MSDSVVLAWTDPTTVERPKTKAEKLMEELEDNPNRWALIHQGVCIYEWWYPLKKKDDYEVKLILHRPVGTGLTTKEVYARYVGPPGNASGV